MLQDMRSQVVISRVNFRGKYHHCITHTPFPIIINISVLDLVPWKQTETNCCVQVYWKELSGDLPERKWRKQIGQVKKVAWNTTKASVDTLRNFVVERWPFRIFPSWARKLSLDIQTWTCNWPKAAHGIRRLWTRQFLVVESSFLWKEQLWAIITDVSSWEIGYVGLKEGFWAKLHSVHCNQ